MFACCLDKFRIMYVSLIPSVQIVLVFLFLTETLFSLTSESVLLYLSVFQCSATADKTQMFQMKSLALAQHKLYPNSTLNSHSRKV